MMDLSEKYKMAEKEEAKKLIEQLHKLKNEDPHRVGPAYIRLFCGDDEMPASTVIATPDDFAILISSAILSYYENWGGGSVDDLLTRINALVKRYAGEENKLEEDDSEGGMLS